MIRRKQRCEALPFQFVERMTERGYTERQVRRLVEWYMRVNKAG